MRVTEYIQQSKGKPFISIEIIPPKKGKNIEEIFDELEKLKRYGVSVMSVTSHAHERTFEKVDGNIIERIKSKRLDTNAICVSVKARGLIEPIPHIICAGFSKDETEDALYTLNFQGISNVLALRGDFPADYSKIKQNGFTHKHARDLVEQIVNMNRGVYLDPVDNPINTNFCIGVAGYPEKHRESPDLATDIQYLREKVEAGAHFIITQMFFDNEAFFRFVESARLAGITVPIIPGIKPLYIKKHLTSLPEIFHVSVPQALRDTIEKFDAKEDVKKAGIEYCVKQCQELLEFGVPGLHFYTMSSADPTADVLEGLL